MVIGPERPRSYGPTPEKDGPVRLSVGPRSFGPVSHIIRPSVFLRTAVFLRPIGLFSFFLQINNFFSLTLLGIAMNTNRDVFNIQIFFYKSPGYSFENLKF